MQWDASANGGFSSVTPWLPVHDDYQQVNSETESADPESPLSWFRRLAALRDEREELVTGDYEELMPSSEQVYAYRRAGERSTCVVLANLSADEVSYDTLLVSGMTPLVGTHGEALVGTLRPLEAVVFGS